MTLYRTKPSQVDAMQWTGNNINYLWDWGNAAAIYGPTETTSDTLLLTTIDDVQVPCPVGHWVIRERNWLDRFYPCDPTVFASKYEPVDADGAHATLPESARCSCTYRPAAGVGHWSYHELGCAVREAGRVHYDPVYTAPANRIHPPADGWAEDQAAGR